MAFLPVLSQHITSINSDNGIVNLNGNCYYVEDSLYSARQVLNLDNKEWSSLSERGPLFGISKNPKWVKLNLFNQGESTINRNLYIPYSHIYSIKLYHFIEDSLIKKVETGTKSSYSAREYNDQNFIIRLTLPPKQNSTLLLYLNHPYMPLKAPLYLMDSKSTLETNRFNNSVLWFWRGLFFFSMVISLILYFLIRNRLYGYYFLLNLGVMMFIGAEIGDYFMFFDSDPHNFIINVKEIGVIFVLIYFPRFLDKLVNIKESNPKLWRLMNYGIYFTWITWILSVLPGLRNSSVMYYTTIYIISISVIVFLLQLYFLIIATLNKKDNSSVLLLVYLIYIGGVATSVILPNLDILEQNPYTNNVLIFGSMYEIISFLFIIGRETYAIFKERSELLERQRKHQVQIMQEVLDSQDKERLRIGQELHDTVGANLSYVLYNIPDSEIKIKESLNTTISSVRDISHGLIQTELSEDEFVDQVKYIANKATNDKLKVRSLFSKWPDNIDQNILMHLIRIVQELVNNGIKHSKGDSIYIQFLYDNDLHFVYEDNGVGFNTSITNTNGIGLKSIFNRVKLLNGKIEIDSKPNDGCSIFITIPFR